MKKIVACAMCVVLVFSLFPLHGIALPAERDEQPEQETFVFPQSDDVSFEPQVVLVELDGDASVDEVSAAIDDLGYVSTVSEAAEGIVSIEFASSWEAEDATNALLEKGIAVAAQPNYVYTLPEDELAQDVAEVDDGAEVVDAIEPGEGEVQEVSDLEVLPEEQSVELGEGLPGEDVLLDTQATSINDPRNGEQWSLSRIKAYDAWDLIKSNHKVTVATMDLGFDVTHQDLKANIVDPYNSTNGTSTVTPVNGTTPNKNHGTHVAGIVAAVANNGLGVAGGSYNANVMPIKVVRDNGMAYTNDLLKAFDYAISKKASRNVRVINLSMGSAKEVSADDLLVQKIKEAYDKSIVIVAAAGNLSASNTGKVPYHIYPADYPPIVSVVNLVQTATGVERWYTSNYNFEDEVTKDIAAPGANILSTAPGNSYAYMTGTSMAAPLVSAVLALEFAANPGLTATGAVERLYASTTKLTNKDFDLQYGWGEVNAYQAVRAAMYGADSTRLAKVRKQMGSEGIPSQVFADVSTSTSHYEDVYWLAENGISTGWATSMGQVFRPYASVARADMATFLFRLAKFWGMVSDTWQPTAAQKKKFVDVSGSTPHAREIWWLASTGISEGWSTSKGREFRPYATIARADMAAFLHRLANLQGIDAPGTALTFVDVNARTPHYEDIRWLSSAGISSGWYATTGRQFRPYASTARADMAVFLHKLDNLW